MIAFRYTKIDGAEYLSHLDLLRHIDRSMRRAGIKVCFSQGFNKHPRIFMNNPLPLGVKSLAEYCFVETDFEGDFKELFNAHSPKGIKCVDYRICSQNPNYANNIERALYRISGILPFDTASVMATDSIVIADSKGRQVDIRPRLYKLYFEGDMLYFEGGCGENNLRPDVFLNYLLTLTSKATRENEILKVECYGKDVF